VAAAYINEMRPIRSTGTSSAMQMSENAHKLILISPPVIDES
jgi:hypothetical protein